MRVALIGPYPRRVESPAGGVETAVASLADSLSRMEGVEVVVVDPFTGYPPDSSEPIRVMRLPQLRPLRSGSARVPREVVRAIRASAPDLVHVHLMPQLASVHPVSVVTVHGFPHRETYLRNPGVRGRVAAWILRRPFAAGLRNAGQVIAISDEVIATARGLGADAVRIPNPVDRRFFEVVRRGGPDFLSVGDIMRRKNQLLLIRSFRQFVETGGSGRLLIAGAIGDRAYYAECVAAASGLDGRVKFLGQIDRNALLENLATARAAVSTSLRETSSIALAEALAANCPVVTLDSGTAREQVGTDGAGLVLPLAATVADVSEALHQVPAQSHLSAARDAVLGQHPSEVARQTLRVYQTALANGPQRPEND